MKRTLLTLTLAAALCLPALFAQKSAAEEPIVLTFNLGMPPIHQRWVNAIKPWCDDLEIRSNGRIKIEPYFANALGKRSDAMDSVRTGIADLAEAPFSSNPGAFPFHSQIFSAANPSMALGNAYEMLSDFYKAHPEVLKKEIKGVKVKFHGIVSPGRVAAKALKDAKKGKDMSVCSLYVKCQHLNVKLMPQKLTMKLWLNSIKKYL